MGDLEPMELTCSCSDLCLAGCTGGCGSVCLFTLVAGTPEAAAGGGIGGAAVGIFVPSFEAQAQ